MNFQRHLREKSKNLNKKKGQGVKLNLNVDNKDVFMSTSGMSIDKKKPSILLMHGSGLTHIVWSLHEQFYSANGFNVLSVDLPGH